MIGRRVVLKRGGADDAEKPFWISFADLMTALMVLFLVCLSVALSQADKARRQAESAAAEARNQQSKAEEAKVEAEKLRQQLEAELKRRDTRKEHRDREIIALLDSLQQTVARHEGVALDRERKVIDFGARAQFASDRHDLSLEQANVLRALVPDLLGAVRDAKALGSDWLKRVVVEGFTDYSGSYLHNLNLSLQRSQRVLCVLMAKEWPASPPKSASTQAESIETSDLLLISDTDVEEIRRIFLVGGYSSNSQKDNKEESRRIELRLEFYALEEDRTSAISVANSDGASVGKCALGWR